MDIVRKLKIAVLCVASSMVAICITVIIYQAYKVFFYTPEELKIHNAVKRPVKFFQIGFSKCGTKSMAEFFRSNYVAVVHHEFGYLAVNMDKNYKHGLPLLPSGYESFYGFFDMERLYDLPLISIPKTYFAELDRQYPGSKFILNIRNKDAWLKSKARHPAYHHEMRWLDLHAQFFNKSKEEVLQMWSKEWDEHYIAVLEYFKDRPSDLLVFDIDHDMPEKICEFFKEYFRLDPKLYAHKNKSADRDRERIINY